MTFCGYVAHSAPSSDAPDMITFAALNLERNVQVRLPDEHTPTRRCPSSARPSVTTRRCMAQLPVPHLLIHYELQGEVAHAEKREQHPAIEAALALVVECRAGPACRAHNCQ